jgi:UDP-glucose 6-dehydrogenase
LETPNLGQIVQEEETSNLTATAKIKEVHRNVTVTLVLVGKTPDYEHRF